MVLKKSSFEIEAEREKESRLSKNELRIKRCSEREDALLEELRKNPLYMAYKKSQDDLSSAFDEQSRLISGAYLHNLILSKMREFAKEHKVEVILDIGKEKLPKNLRSFSLRRYIGPRDNIHGVKMDYVYAGDFNLDLYIFNPKDIEVLGDIERRVYSLGDEVHDEAILGSFRDRIDTLFEIRISDDHESGIARMPGDFQTEERELMQRL